MKEATAPAALRGSVQLKKDLGTRVERWAHSPDEGDSSAPPLRKKRTNLSILVLSSSSNLLTVDLVFQLPGYQVKEAKKNRRNSEHADLRKGVFPTKLVNRHMAF